MIHIYCNVADFYDITFAFRRADFYHEIPSIGSQEEDPSPQRSGLLVFLYYLLIFYYLFFQERKLCDEQKARRRTAFQLATFPSALSVCRLIVGRLAIATTQRPTSTEDHRLLLGPFAEAMDYFYLPLRVN